MRILAIETSCDETAAAIVENGTLVQSNVVASSVALHAKTGGIIPEEAARQQIKSMLPVLTETLGANIPKALKTIDALAATVGPGLIGSLLVGVETAKTLALVWNKPLIPVNHLVGHIYANWLTNDSNKQSVPEFPAIALIVSGGHTDLVLLKSHTKIQWLGGTRDDASGEAFDKTARLLDLSYPGGPSISKAANDYLLEKPKAKLDLFPRPMLTENNLDFSFSGLKTAVANKVTEYIKTQTEIPVNAVAAQVQEAIVDVLVTKTLRAIQYYKPKSLLLAGGVSANGRLRARFKDAIEKEAKNISLFIPEVKYCTDNAAGIGSAAFFHQGAMPWSDITANPELTVTDLF